MQMANVCLSYYVGWMIFLFENICSSFCKDWQQCLFSGWDD